MDKKVESAIQCLESYCNERRIVKCKEEDFQVLRLMIQRIIGALKNCMLSILSRVFRWISESVLYAPNFLPECYLRTSGKFGFWNSISGYQTFPDRSLRVLIVRLFSRLLGKSGKSRKQAKEWVFLRPSSHSVS